MTRQASSGSEKLLHVEGNRQRHHQMPLISEWLLHGEAKWKALLAVHQDPMAWGSEGPHVPLGWEGLLEARASHKTL